jgi:MFS family permease
MGGFLVGPLLGGIIASSSLDLVFVFAAVLCFAAAIPVLLIPRSALVKRTPAAAIIPSIDLNASRARRLMPAVIASAAPEYLVGAITGVWAIYIIALGGEAWQVGLSFTLFALPAVLLSIWFGGLVDRIGGRVVMGGALIAIAVLMPFFVVTSAVPLVLGLLAITGIAVAAEKPVVYTEVVRVADPDEYARAQGVLQIGLMIAQSVGAIAAGYLYGASPALVFGSVVAVCAISLLGVPRLQARMAAKTLSPEAAPGSRSDSRPGPAG